MVAPVCHRAEGCQKGDTCPGQPANGSRTHSLIPTSAAEIGEGHDAIAPRRKKSHCSPVCNTTGNHARHDQPEANHVCARERLTQQRSNDLKATAAISPKKTVANAVVRARCVQLWRKAASPS